MNKTELLSPAKDKFTAIEAINCGADAIYIGASKFGARHNANNSLSDIKEVIEYAHKFWVKVYVTVNTILNDNELDDAVKLVKLLYEINADAVIIQDMGLLKRIAEEKIHIPIHVSTQCDNRDIEKVKFFEKLNVSRVVLARELSLNQIKEIHKNAPNIELEAFVHGALCVSYSGQCYLSQYIGGRSANRGECAQPCRKKYDVIDDKGNILLKDAYALCLKDFNASESLEEMSDNGILSFKIEGRLKSPEYVKNVTAYYREKLDEFSVKTSSGKSFYEFSPDVYKTFNRDYTNYFLKNREECYNYVSPKSRGKYIGKVKYSSDNYFVLDTNEQLSAQDGIVYITENKMFGFLINKIDGNKIYPNKNLKLRKGIKLYRNVDVEFEKQLKLPIKRKIRIDVEILNSKIIITDEDCNKISSEIPKGEISQNQEKSNETFKKQLLKTGDSDFYIDKFSCNENLPFLPVSKINDLRRNLLDKLMTLRIKNYNKEKAKEINYTKYYKREVDYRANVHNKEAEKFYNKCGCIVIEKSLESKFPQRQIELMRTKHCIKYSIDMCQKNINLFLQDEHKVKYPLKFDCKKCEMIICNDIKDIYAAF